MQIIWPKINYLVSSIQLQPWYLRGGSIESSSGLSAVQMSGNASLDAATTLGALSLGGLISTGAPINSTVGRSSPPRRTPPYAALISTGTISAKCTHILIVLKAPSKEDTVPFCGLLSGRVSPVVPGITLPRSPQMPSLQQLF